MQVVAYIRVSTDEQVNGTSLDSQKKACEEYAKAKGYKLPAANIFREEGESAKIMDRPQLLRMLEFCRVNKGKISHCIVWKVDRLARNLEYHTAIRAALNKLGIQLVSVTEPIADDPMGKAMEGMLAVFAQLDNDVRAARTTAGMKARTEQGGWVHDAPPGYEKDKTPSGVPTLKFSDMAKNVRKFLELFSSGGYSVAQAADLAYELGIRTRTGNKRPWQSIRNLLGNPLYAGFINTKFTNGEAIKGLHPPLISEATYYRIQRILSNVDHNFSKHAEADWPLRGGFLIHLPCGKPMTGSSPKGRSGPSPRYHCTHCKASVIGMPTSRSRDQVHAEFLELLGGIRPDKGTIKLYKEIILRRWNDAYKESRELVVKLNEEIEAGRDKKSRLTDLYIDGKLNEEDFNIKKDSIEKGLQQLNLRLAEASVDIKNKEQVVDDAMAFMFNPGTYWNQAHIAIKKRIQDSVFPEGLEYDCKEGFGTVKLAESYLLINKIAPKGDSDSNLVTLPGLEPGLPP